MGGAGCDCLACAFLALIAARAEALGERDPETGLVYIDCEEALAAFGDAIGTLIAPLPGSQQAAAMQIVARRASAALRAAGDGAAQGGIH